MLQLHQRSILQAASVLRRRIKPVSYTYCAAHTRVIQDGIERTLCQDYAAKVPDPELCCIFIQFKSRAPHFGRPVLTYYWRPVLTSFLAPFGPILTHFEPPLTPFYTNRVPWFRSWLFLTPDAGGLYSFRAKFWLRGSNRTVPLQSVCGIQVIGCKCGGCSGVRAT